MICTGCGFCVTPSDAPASHRCNACGSSFRYESDDFLLHQLGAEGRDVRPSQVEMGRLVEKAIRTNAIAITEAPVGSGKSDAYGVPAVITALEAVRRHDFGSPTPEAYMHQGQFRVTHRRVVIATAKKNLQHQIAEKDLPFIAKRRGAPELRIALLKGKGNYGCRVEAMSSLAGDRLKAYYKWAADSEYEDLGTFPGSNDEKYKINAEECLGASCPNAQGDEPRCGYWRAKLDAAQAHIVVTNHHLVAFDLAYGPCRILGPYTTLIIDEAHQVPSSFRSALSRHISPGVFSRLIRLIDGAGMPGDYPKDIRELSTRMFEQLKGQEGTVLKDPFGSSAQNMVELLKLTQVAASKHQGETSSSNDEVTEDNEISLKAAAVVKTIESLSQTISDTKEPGSNTVMAVSTMERGNKKLTLSPISVGQVVGPKLQQIPSLVCTSATLMIDKSFKDFRSQVGLLETKRPVYEKDYPTPFNYKAQALLYLPRHMPLPVAGRETPGRTPYIAAVANECFRLITASKGNAFLLFTSRQDLEDVHEALLESDVQFPLLVQAEDAGETFQQYMATPNSVLLGLKSFWEGVDVQGQKLQLVVITKLPFPHPDEPVLQARVRALISEQLELGVKERTAEMGAFEQVQVPAMLTDLRQGAGRLIRAKTDKGVLAILDPRVFTGSSKARPTADQTTFHGYGGKAVEATGFTNHIFEFDTVQRIMARW